MLSHIKRVYPEAIEAILTSVCIIGYFTVCVSKALVCPTIIPGDTFSVQTLNITSSKTILYCESDSADIRQNDAFCQKSLMVTSTPFNTNRLRRQTSSKIGPSKSNGRLSLQKTLRENRPENSTVGVCGIHEPIFKMQTALKLWFLCFFSLF